jgi:hypothetical protein
MWTCPKCGEKIEDQFDSCWKCAAEPKQVEVSTHRLNISRRIFVGCKIGAAIWFLAVIVIQVLAPSITDGRNPAIAIFLVPLICLAFWPNFLLGYLLHDVATGWLLDLEPLFEFVVSLTVWLLISALVSVIVHAISRKHHAA